MKQTYRLFFAFCLIFFGASVASAQRGAGAAHPHPVVSAHAHQVLSSGRAPSRPISRRPSGTLNPRSINGVPGLGFDYEHLAAINHDLAEKALIDPVTREELALGRRFRGRGFAPVYFLGGYGYPYEDSAVYEPPQPEQPQESQPQVIVIQQPAPATAPVVATASQDPPSATPEREIENFALVLKDGSRITAVAFTRQGDQVVYITNEGRRQYVSIAQVDADATTRINEDRGTPLKLSL